MAITYEEALETLKSMFGDPWTEQTLDAVLRHHEGHMENTVETVLAHGDGDPAELVKRLQDPTAAVPATSPGGGSVANDEAIARQLAGGQGASTGGSAAGGGAGTKKQRGTPTQLPPDFLRIPGKTQGGGSAGGAAAAAAGGSTMDSDEQLARMLQDELFTQELRNNPEFAHLAGQGQGRGRGASQPPRASAFGGLGGGFPGLGRGRGSGGQQPQQQQEGPNVMDKLSEMGESTRKKLSIFAQQFNDRVRNPQGAGMAPTPAPAAERRGLLDLGEDDEEEVSFLGGQDRNVEMGQVSSPGGKKDD